MINKNKEKDFEETIVKYSALIAKICYYFSSDPEEFKDLRQEILINIWKGWEKFLNESKISTWIYRVCFNTCISYQRKEKKFRNNISIEDLFGIEAPLENDRYENYRVMLTLIKELNYEERALILMWLDEKSYDEISSLTGINRNTIGVKLMRIKEKLIRLSSNYR